MMCEEKILTISEKMLYYILEKVVFKNKKIYLKEWKGNDYEKFFEINRYMYGLIINKFF